MAPPILSFLEMAGGMFHGEPFDKNFLSLLAKHPSTMIIKRVRQDKAAKSGYRLFKVPSHNVSHQER
jgi:hypothetical protein